VLFRSVAVNALVVGVVSPAAGWAVIRAPWGFPWQFAVLGLLFAAALYVPTTVTDLAADTGAGDTTFAVRFGPRVAYGIGIALWGLALAVCLACAALGVLVPRSTLGPQLLTIPVLLGAYAILTRRPTITKLAMLSVVFGIPTLGFVLAYV